MDFSMCRVQKTILSINTEISGYELKDSVQYTPQIIFLKENNMLIFLDTKFFG